MTPELVPIEDPRRIDQILVMRFRNWAEAPDLGMCTSGDAEDIECLVDNLVGLAKEVRMWLDLSRCKATVEKLADGRSDHPLALMARQLEDRALGHFGAVRA